MEVGEEERYACAALFTLALHATQVDYGASSETLPAATAWGAGDEDQWEAEASRAEELKEPSEAVWAAFWGWDCCGPGGILDRLYTALKIPERSWSGLKRLPEVGGLTYERRQQYLQLVSSFLQVLDSTLPAAHVTSRSYRALSDTSTQRPPASRTHIGYLPKVDDMLGLTESPAKAAPSLSQAQPDDAAADDPFAASMHVLPGGVPGSLRDAQSGRQVDETDATALAAAAAAASGGEDVGIVLKERETEMLLDDSDSELEADLVFAHVMSRRPGAHATPQPDPTAEFAKKEAANAVGTGSPGALPDPKEDFREGLSGAESTGKGASRAESGAEACGASPWAGAGKAEPGEASQQTQAINSDLMSSMIHSSGAQCDEPPGTSQASLPPIQSAQVAESPATQDAPAQSGAHAASGGVGSTSGGNAAMGSTGGTGGDAGELGETAVAAQLTRRSGQKRAKPSHKAVAAMWELLESCIAQPQPQDPTQGESKEEDGPLQRAAAKHPPRARWYDARSRIALRRVASWLNVPWPTVANFEHLLAYQLLLPSEPEDGQRTKRAATAWENSIWAAKIGATTVGIGALFALTGGLAAPAIASGIGAAITMAGGGAAAAAGATGFLATTAGTAAVVSGMGVAGGSYAGTHMARRIGNVKEFGFWEVNESTLLNIYEVPPPEVTESLKGAASLDAPSRKEETPGATPSKAAEEAKDGAQEKVTSMGKEDSEQGWASSWDQTEATPQAARPERPAEFNPTFSPRGEPDDFLRCRSPNDPKTSSNQSRSGSVAVELKELQPSSHTRSLMDMDPPMPDSDAGHISFSAFPRMGSACLSVTSTSARSPRPAPTTTQTAASPATERASSAGPQLDEKPSCAEDLKRAASGREASSSRQRNRGQGEECGEKGAGPSRDGSKKDLPDLARGNAAGSSASLDSMGEPKKKRGALDKDGKRWLWKPKFKEPALLLAPISPHSRADDMRMSITIGVNGWIGDRKDYLKIWASLKAPDSEVFTLVWESKELLALNNAIVSFMAQQAYQEIAKYTLVHFFYTGLVAAFATPWLLVSFSQMIDHAWVVALDRAQKAGVLLAHTLMAGGHGDRPVILVGYSMGARLIFHCLLELCRHNAKGVVEHVVLMGVPVSTRVERWAMARSAVAGRFVNAYSRRDWVLGLIYRGANGFVKGAGGLCPMKCPGIENINLTSIIAGHFDYISKMPEILDLVGIYG